MIRAGYGIYRNTAVYQSLALMLAQQPPLSRTLSIESTAAQPLTLANGFNAPAKPLANTFAVDPDFRVSYAHNWQASVQRDFPASLTVTATYLGTKGSRLMQEFVPNTYPIGASNPCAACPSGFVYLVSERTLAEERRPAAGAAAIEERIDGRCSVHACRRRRTTLRRSRLPISTAR